MSGRNPEPIRLLAFLLLLGTGSASAAPAPSCEPDYDPRCAWINAGDAPLGAVAGRGDEAIRFDYSAFLRPSKVFSIEVSRDAKGVVRIAMHAPLAWAQMVPRAVPASAWPRFVALRARVLAAHAAAMARIKAENPRMLTTVRGHTFVDCFDPGRLSIGSALGRKVEQIALTACATREVDDIADQIHDAVYDLLPFCRKMKETVAFGCGALGGDGEMAARYAADVLAASRPCGAEGRPALAADAVLRIGDSPIVRGKKIFTTLCRQHKWLMVDRIDAGGDTLTATGRMVEGANDGAWLEARMVAPASQAWRIEGGRAMLQQWTVGKFEAYRPKPPSPAPMPE